MDHRETEALPELADRVEPVGLDLVEGAIRLVAAGAASRVSLSELGGGDEVAFEAAAIAQTYGVRLHVERASDGHQHIVVGPLDVA